MKNKSDTLDIIQSLEQFEAMVTNIAPVIAEYYKALIANGTPHQLAEDLTRDWHNLFWEINLRPKNE